MKPVTMKTKLISQAELEPPGPCPAEAGSRTMLLARFKYLLRLPQQGANAELEPPCLGPVSSQPGSCPWKKLLLALGTVLTLTLMVLLLVWHYKCIVIDRSCEGNSEVLPPLFKGLQRQGR